MNKATRLREGVVKRSSIDHINRTGYLTILADLYLYRYKEKKNYNDIEQSIQTAHLAVSATDDDHPIRTKKLETQGKKYRKRYHKKSLK